MGKRSAFARAGRDFYPTPAEPVNLLSPFLGNVEAFAEPFVGNGALAGHLAALGFRCGFASDILPFGDADRFGAVARDALTIDELDLVECSHVISNPPWPAPRAAGQPTLKFIHHLAALRPTWLLLAADFKHNVYAPEVMGFCSDIVSVGRVRWIPDTDNDGKDNAAWYLFDAKRPGPTIFHSRAKRQTAFSADLEALL